MSTLSMRCPSFSESSALRVSPSALACSATASTELQRNDRASSSRSRSGRSVRSAHPAASVLAACRRICLARYAGSPRSTSQAASAASLTSLIATRSSTGLRYRATGTREDSMSQTNAIILRIKKERTKEFEEAFGREQYKNWEKHVAKGGFLAASLTRVEYGSEEDASKKGGYVNYIVFAKLTGMRAHTAHDNDPDFKAWDEKAEAFQPEGPSRLGWDDRLRDRPARGLVTDRAWALRSW